MEVAAFVIGTSGLIAVVDKIFELSRVMHDIKCFPKDMAELAIQLHHEKQKINLWSAQTTFRSRAQTQSSTTSHDSGLFQDALLDTMRRCTEGVTNSLEDANRLERYYISDTAEDEEGQNPDGSAGNTLATTRADYYKALRSQLEDVLQRRVTRRRRLAAVTKLWDRPHMEEFKQVLGRLKYWNAELFLLLDLYEKSDIRVELSARMMADYSDDPEALSIIGNIETTRNEDIAASARLSLQMLDLEDKNENSQPTSNSWLNPSLSKDETPQRFIDWLDCSSLTDAQMSIAAKRIDALCELLNMAKPQELTTLKPIGYIFDREKMSYGIISETHNAVRKIISLNRILGTNKSHSLDERFSLARRLCHTFLQLHMSNWLHRGFNSTCVNFYTTSDSKEINFLAVTGFQFARPAGGDQISLPITQSQASLALYHHPDVRMSHLQGSTKPYVRYMAKHDIFSLGVVLLEIGVWQRVASLKLTGSEPIDLQRYAEAHLPYLMGKGYAKIVDRCLSGRNTEGGGSQEGSELSWLLYDIVKPMDVCHCGMSV